MTTDAHAACVGAHGGRDGGIIIIGTGSIGWAERKGLHYRVGGWGWPISDEGSGAWIGYEALRRLLWAYDGRIDWSPLLRALFARFEQDPHAILQWTVNASPRDLGSLAPLIVEHAAQNDRVGRELMRMAAVHIDGLAERLISLGTQRLSVVGGLAEHVAPWLSPVTKSHHRCAGRRCAGWRAASGAADRRTPALSAARARLMDERDRQMATEFREAPVVVRRQAEALAAPLAELAARLKRRPPDVVVTCARGSSAHAATFGKHLFERHLGIICAPAAPNIASVYRKQMRLRDQLFLSISQSGRSDDLVESAAHGEGVRRHHRGHGQ